MLTREQVEKIKTYGKWGDDIDALCDMALAWLEVQPRPISEAPKDEWLFGLDNDGWLYGKPMAWNKAKKAWCDLPDGDRFESFNPTHFIPLSALPAPDKVT